MLVNLWNSGPVSAQPSGGPYGPIQQQYELPQDAKHVYYVAPDGSQDAAGNAVERPTTLEAAIERVVTGDAIILSGGTYRTGGLRLNQQVTIQPYQDERPVLKGTRVATDWESPRDGLWRTAWDTLFPMQPQPWWRREREERRTPLYKFNGDMVFLDGRRLDPVGAVDDVDSDSFYVDYDAKQVYLGTNPAGREVEITAFDAALTRTTQEVHGKHSDGRGPTVRGIMFTEYAFRAIELEGYDPEGVSPESEHGKDVVGSTFEHCTFSHCARVAGYFRGDGLTIRHCLVSDTGTEGIFVLNSNDVLLERNIITRNNITNITGYYASAVKIYNQCHRVTCRDNLVIDNPHESSGIWYDVGEVDGVFVNNWIERTDNGFFFEISQGAICAGNVFVDCGTGIKILNACAVRVYQNTLVNSTAWIERTPRSAVGDHFGWHPATGPGVDEREGHVLVGNLFVGEEGFRRPLLNFEQAPALRHRLSDPQVSTLDHNVYVQQSAADSGPLIVWSPAPGERSRKRFDSPAELHAEHSAFEANSRLYADYYGPLFKGRHLSRFELVPEFPGSDLSASIPERVQRLLGRPGKAIDSPGAFPVRR
jgi:hypothetical protein